MVDACGAVQGKQGLSYRCARFLIRELIRAEEVCTYPDILKIEPCVPMPPRGLAFLYD